VNVTIQERRFSFTSEYEISALSRTYYASRSLFSFKDKLQLRSEDGRVLARIRSYFAPFRRRHDFHLRDGRILRFQCEKIWKQVFICEGKEELYRLYEHKGLKYSIFQKDRQIAAFVKNRVVTGKGNQYALRMDSDADLAVVLCMVLAISSSENDDHQATATIDLGNIGPEDRPFDESWEPR